MTSNEAEEFEKIPWLSDILTMRTWDEQAKRIDATTPTLNYYKTMCIKYLSSL